MYRINNNNNNNNDDDKFVTTLDSRNCDREIHRKDNNDNDDDDDNIDDRIISSSSSSSGSGDSNNSSGGGGGGGGDDGASEKENDNTTITKRKGKSLSIQNKKRKNNESRKKQIQQHTSSSSFQILGKRYSLTKTGYKFLNIGIVLKYPSSYVDITLGSYQSKGISFSPDTWKKFLEQRHRIISYLQCDKKKKDAATAAAAAAFPPPPPPSPIYVGETMMIQFGQINGVPTLRLKTSTGRLTLHKDIILSIFNYEHCVNFHIISLSKIIDNIDAKMLRICEFASTMTTTMTTKEIAKTIQDNESLFNRNDIIDCELIALLFPFYTTTTF